MELDCPFSAHPNGRDAAAAARARPECRPGRIGAMPAGHGLRSRTRDLFSKGYRKNGTTPLTDLLRVYKTGEHVDIKVNSAVHAGMPHKWYHGKTGVIWNVTKRAVGVEVNKQARAGRPGPLPPPLRARRLPSAPRAWRRSAPLAAALPAAGRSRRQSLCVCAACLCKPGRGGFEVALMCVCVCVLPPAHVAHVAAPQRPRGA